MLNTKQRDKCNWGAAKMGLHQAGVPAPVSFFLENKNKDCKRKDLLQGYYVAYNPGGVLAAQPVPSPCDRKRQHGWMPEGPPAKPATEARASTRVLTPIMKGVPSEERNNITQ